MKYLRPLILGKKGEQGEGKDINLAEALSEWTNQSTTMLEDHEMRQGKVMNDVFVSTHHNFVSSESTLRNHKN